MNILDTPNYSDTRRHESHEQFTDFWHVQVVDQINVVCLVANSQKGKVGNEFNRFWLPNKVSKCVCPSSWLH